jgi:DNA invertase Pin-like site-specific DNA recombinase
MASYFNSFFSKFTTTNNDMIVNNEDNVSKNNVSKDNTNSNIIITNNNSNPNTSNMITSNEDNNINNIIITNTNSNLNNTFNNVSQVYIYYRVSTSRQAGDFANGLDRQTNACERYIESNLKKQINNINYYCDIGSSYNNKSKLPQLQKMLRELQPNSVICIYDVSRLGRNTQQVFSALRRVTKLNSKIIAVEDNMTFGVNKMIDKRFYNKVIQAETESDIKSVNAKQKIAILKKNKIHIGKVPFGYSLENKQLIINSDEQKIINLLIEKYKELKSYVKVAEHYNNMNMLYRNNAWSSKTISYLINKNNNITNKMNSLNIV